MNTAIVLAAGKGSRMNAGINKQYIEIKGKPIIAYTLDVFQSCNYIDEIILVAAEEELEACGEIIGSYRYNKVKTLIAGGKERQDSVRIGISQLSKSCEIVIIHDGARMLVSHETIKACIEAAKLYGAASAGVPVKDTIKIVSNDGKALYTPNRKNIWITQTPQAFKLDIIITAHNHSEKFNIKGTDDAALAEIAGCQVKMVEADYENIKLTTPEDLIIAEAILNNRLQKLSRVR